VTDFVVTATTPGGSASATFRTALTSGQDLVALAQSAGPGATITLGPGLHIIPFGQQITALADQKWVSPGRDTVIDGTVPLTGWTRSGPGWWAPAALSGAVDTQAQCELADNGCQRQEAVWLDGRKLTRVMAQAALVTGTFWADYTTGRVWVADDPAAGVVMSRTQTAFASSAANVLLDGITFQRFANRAQTGMVEARGPGWEIRNCIVQDSHGWGAGSRGAAGAYWHDNVFRRNGQLGLGVPSSNAVSDTRIVGNEFTGNNTDGFYQNDWESGACKVTRGGGTFSGNNVHGERGVGFWADVFASGWKVDGNTFTDCPNGAVRYEISANGRITNNTIVCGSTAVGARAQGTSGWYGPLGMSAININTAQDVVVSGNRISGSAVINGICAQVSTRLGQATGWTGKYAQVTQGNVVVTDNDVTETFTTPSAGFPNIAAGLILRSGVAASYLSAASASFDRNTYRVPAATDKRFVWTTGYAYSTFAAYRTASGQDANSVLVAG
jgi:hypothetical protein